MDSFELNKVLGAVLGTCLALLSLNIAAGALFTVHNPEKPGFEVAVQEEAPAGKPGEAAPADEPLPVRFANADVKRGESDAKKCAACHTFGKGEPNRVGPNLYGVVGRPKHIEPGFNYSAAMKKQEGNWTPEELDHFLTNPRAAVPGTAMTFAGLPRGKERADVITFLNTKSDKPVELPKQAAAPAAEKQAAGGGDKPQGDAKPAAAPQQGNAPAAKAPEAPKPPEAKPPEAKPAEAPKAQ
jgi:cytochrome c